MTRLILLILSTLCHLQQLEAQEENPVEAFISKPDLCSEPRGKGFYDGFFSHESECNKFYQCGKGGIISEFQCPGGTLWNQNAKHCDWIRNVPSCMSVVSFMDDLIFLKVKYKI